MKTKQIQWQLFQRFFILLTITGIILYFVLNKYGVESYIVVSSVWTGAFFCSFLISRSYAQRIKDIVTQMRNFAKKIARGDFSSSLEMQTNDPWELKKLGKTLNIMSSNFEKSVQKVKDQKEQIDSILASMQEGILTLTKDGLIRNYNQALMNLFNLGPLTENKGKNLIEVFRIAPLEQLYNKIIQNKNIFAESELNLLSGTLIQVKATPLKEADIVKGVLLVFTDITRSREFEKSRRDFVSNVSHELRTPLTSIKGYVETLKDKKGIDSETENRFLGIISNEASRLSNLVEDLLRLAKIENDEASEALIFDEIKINDLILRLKSYTHEKAQEKNINLDVQGDLSWSINGNETLILQALVNLVDNAIKHSPQNTDIHILCEDHDPYIEISVKDYGPGIAKEHQERIFERFYSIDSSRSSQQAGSGIGLSIVKHVINSHRGKVQVQSTSGEGAKFTIRLPKKSF